MAKQAASKPCEVSFTRSNSQEPEDERWTLRIKYNEHGRSYPVRVEVELDDAAFSRLMSCRLVTGAMRQRIIRNRKA